MNLPPLHSLRLCEPSCARRAASTGTGIDTLPEGLECSICRMDLNKTAEDGLDVPPGAEKPWVFACANHHVFHKLCLLNQFQAGDTRCADCRGPLLWPEVAPPAAAAAVLTAPAFAAPAPADATPATRLRAAVERRDVSGMMEALNLNARARLIPGQQRELMYMVVRDSTATATTGGRMVRALLNAGFPANGYDGHNTFTGYAASRGWVDAVAHLLEHGGALLSIANGVPITPLAWAVDGARNNVVKLLLRTGPHWNALTEATKLRMTPQRTVFQLQREFHWAGSNSYLLQLAARADSRHDVLETLLEMWDEYNRNLPEGHDDPGAISFESVRGDRAFVEACARGKAENAKLLLTYVYDPNDVPHHEGLRAAIENNRVQVVELFLSDRDEPWHVDPDYALNATFRTGSNGIGDGDQTMSPLIFAIVRERFAIAQLLLNGGADVNAARVWPNGVKATVLFAAVVSVDNHRVHGAQVADGELPEMNLLRSILSKRPDPTPIVAIQHPTREPMTVLQWVEEWTRRQGGDPTANRIRGLLVSTYPEWYDADGRTLLAQERNVAIAPRDPREAAAAGRRDEDDDRDRDRDRDRGAPRLDRDRSRSRDRM